MIPSGNATGIENILALDVPHFSINTAFILSMLPGYLEQVATMLLLSIRPISTCSHQHTRVNSVGRAEKRRLPIRNIIVQAQMNVDFADRPID